MLSVFEDRRTLTLADVTRRVALPKTTVHRLVHELVELGALISVGQSYGVGLRLFEIAAVAQRTELRETAVPILHHLAHVMGSAAAVAILDGTDAVYLERSVPREQARADGFGRPGQRVPAHACAAGKVLLAFGSCEAVKDVFSRELHRIGPKTITDRKVLWKELEMVRSNRVAHECDESAPGVLAMAAPIPDPLRRGRLQGAISVRGPFANQEQTRQEIYRAGVVISRAIRLSDGIEGPPAVTRGGSLTRSPDDAKPVRGARSFG